MEIKKFLGVIRIAAAACSMSTPNKYTRSQQRLGGHPAEPGMVAGLEQMHSFAGVKNCVPAAFWRRWCVVKLTVRTKNRGRLAGQ